MENQRTRLESEDDPNFSVFRTMMEERGEPGAAPAKRSRSSGGKRRVRAVKPKAVERRPNDEEPAVPVVRFHVGGMTCAAKEYYAAHRGLARVHAEQLATLLDAGFCPPVHALHQSAENADMEIYGLTAKQVRTLKSRPRITADYLNSQVEKSVAKTEAA